MHALALSRISSDRSAKLLTVPEFESVNFGRVSLNPEQTSMLSFMNRQMIELCRALPEPLRGTALLTIQRHYTGFQLSNLVNFFTKFYTPSWSIIYWMQQHYSTLQQDEFQVALSAQAMAYFLHMLDDHISDGQLAPSHLLLQLRTQAWMKFTQETLSLAEFVPEGEAIVNSLLARYFSGVHCPTPVVGLDAYCELFRKQLSTTLISPMLTAHRTGCDAIAIQTAYEAFCIAWRLLDDLRDCSSDAFAGEFSAVYHLLSPEFQLVWLGCGGKNHQSPEWRILQQHLEETKVLSTLVTYILLWLREAQQAAESISLKSYASELRQLACPLEELSTVCLQ
jgi:hypothetical protein